MQEVNSKHEILTNFCALTFKDGIKRFESTVAMILVFVQIASPLPFTAWDSLSISPAEAVLYSPDTKVPRTGELALRKAIPANTNMKTIQVIFNTFCAPIIPLYGYKCSYTLFPTGFSGGHLILVKDSTEKALWDNGGQREESSKGITYSIPMCNASRETTC